MRIVVIDAGPLDTLSAATRTRAKIETLVRAGFEVVVPTAVLAEAMTGTARDAAVHHALRRVGTAVTDRATATLAGALRHSAMAAGATPSGVDAIVAAHAVATGEAAVIVTHDRHDLASLVSRYPAVRVLVP